MVDMCMTRLMIRANQDADTIFNIEDYQDYDYNDLGLVDFLSLREQQLVESLEEDT